MEMKIKNGIPYVIVRGDRSGVFAGFLVSQDKSHVILNESRRLWYWDGAASISQIAISGVSKPNSCKFPPVVPSQQILDVIEILPCSIMAFNNIKNVPEWKS